MCRRRGRARCRTCPSSTRASSAKTTRPPNDDHPACDLRAGDYFLSTDLPRGRVGSGWDNTVFIINYDEWGGFFDHVQPPRVTRRRADRRRSAHRHRPRSRRQGRVLTGFRVPCIIASPSRAAGGRRFRDHGLYDHTSVLKLIEWRWNLAPFTRRDASGNRLVTRATSPGCWTSTFPTPGCRDASRAAAGRADCIRDNERGTATQHHNDGSRRHAGPRGLGRTPERSGLLAHLV